MEGLAALMTKLLSSMGDVEARMEARLTLLESRFAAAFPSFTALAPCLHSSTARASSTGA